MFLSKTSTKTVSKMILAGLLLGCTQPMLAQNNPDDEPENGYGFFSREKKEAIVILTIFTALGLGLIYSIIQHNKNYAESVAKALATLTSSGWDETLAKEAIDKCGFSAAGTLKQLTEAKMNPAIATGVVYQYGLNSEKTFAILTEALNKGPQAASALVTKFQEQQYCIDAIKAQTDPVVDAINRSRRILEAEIHELKRRLPSTTHSY
jgi:hypothetical protein